MSDKQCKPGTHKWIPDEENNRTRIDGGNYFKCTECDGMAFDIESYESSEQWISRVEQESINFIQRGLDAIQ